MTMHERYRVVLASLLLGVFAAPGVATAQSKPEQAAPDAAPIYGSQLMTQEERLEHRKKMRSLKTESEREAYRAEHHAQMQERAKSKGVSLPESPPPRGGGMGPGPGMGPGGLRP